MELRLTLSQRERVRGVATWTTSMNMHLPPGLLLSSEDGEAASFLILLFLRIRSRRKDDFCAVHLRTSPMFANLLF